jgi:hypothetical protein
VNRRHTTTVPMTLGMGDAEKSCLNKSSSPRGSFHTNGIAN